MVIPDSYNFNDYEFLNGEKNEDLIGICEVCKQVLDYDYDTIMCFDFGEYHVECYRKWYDKAPHNKRNISNAI